VQALAKGANSRAPYREEHAVAEKQMEEEVANKEFRSFWINTPLYYAVVS
jgi:hypothetical protein